MSDPVDLCFEFDSYLLVSIIGFDTKLNITSEGSKLWSLKFLLSFCSLQLLSIAYFL